MTNYTYYTGEQAKKLWHLWDVMECHYDAWPDDVWESLDKDWIPLDCFKDLTPRFRVPTDKVTPSREESLESAIVNALKTNDLDALKEAVPGWEEK